MHRVRSSAIHAIVIPVVVALILSSGCGEDSSPPVTPDDHLKAIGMVFESSGIRIASILRGETGDTLRAVLDSLGDAITVRFYDENEAIVNPPTGAESSLSWEIEDPAIVEVWQHEGEAGSFEFHLRGLKSGTTHIEYFVLHGDHRDFRSGKIPLTTAP